MSNAIILPELVRILEALLLVHPKPLTIEQLQQLLESKAFTASKAQLKQALTALADAYQQHALELVEVASGYRLQIRSSYNTWTQVLSEEKPSKFSRAMLETLALIAYRQPITRGEIEEVRGVSVSSNIMRSLQEREWIRVVGYREVPGKPAMFATTKAFLDYFNLKGLDELPSLMALRDLSEIERSIPQQLPLTASNEITTEKLLTEHTQATEEVSFRSLLNELDAMEEHLVTEFKDLIPTDAAQD